MFENAAEWTQPAWTGWDKMEIFKTKKSVGKILAI